MQPGKSVLCAGAEVDRLRALDQAPRLEVDALLAMLQRQLDPVADQGLARDQRVVGRALRGAEGVISRIRVTLRQTRTGDRAIRSASHPLRPDRTRSSRARGLFHHPLEPLEAQIGIAQRMGEIEDRVVLGLPVDPAPAPACGNRPAGRTPSRPTGSPGQAAPGRRTGPASERSRADPRTGARRASRIRRRSPMSSGSSRRFQPLMKSDSAQPRRRQRARDRRAPGRRTPRRGPAPRRSAPRSRAGPPGRPAIRRYFSYCGS